MRKDGLPFTERVNVAFIGLSPVLWLVVALMIWGLAAVRTLLRARLSDPSYVGIGSVEPGSRQPVVTTDYRQGWWILAALLVFAGVAGPDTLGPDHGDYLPQRVLLCGLVAMAALVDFETRTLAGRAAVAALTAAFALQSTIVWDYGLHSDQTAGQILRARDAVGRHQRVVAMPVSVRSRFRANPLLHAGNWLGVDSGNVVWNNYETRHYYFPVQFRPGIDRPHPDALEEVLKRDLPDDALDRSRSWERLLARHAGSIDVLVSYKSDARLDAITEQWFDLSDLRGDVRIFQRRDARSRPLVLRWHQQAALNSQSASPP
jgi:hypothetical protein